MGTWDARINGSDTFQEIYRSFFDLYNNGNDPKSISQKIQNDFAAMFDDFDDRNPALFALALAQWETKSLDAEIFNQVKSIIENGQDLEVWKELDPDDKLVEKRKRELEKFLEQIGKARNKAKRRHRPKFEFESVSLIGIISPDRLKRFDITEHFVNKKYVNTSGIMMWARGGGSVMYFTGQSKIISAKWVDGQTLEVIHEKNILFQQQNLHAYFDGDEVKVVYSMTD